MTEVTHVWFLASVDPLVALELRVTVENLAAVGALQHFHLLRFTGVFFAMRCQRARLRVAGPTDLTDVGLFLGVGAAMACEVSGLHEGGVTLGALVGFDTEVATTMRVQVALPSKRLVALVTGKWLLT